MNAHALTEDHDYLWVLNVWNRLGISAPGRWWLIALCDGQLGELTLHQVALARTIPASHRAIDLLEVIG
jgi:hypothetical protein